MPFVFRQAGALLLVAVVPALYAATFHPREPAWSKDRILAPEVTWGTVQEWQRLVLLIDTRSAADFARGHIPGALSLSEGQWERQLPALINAWQPGARMVVYCANPNCGTSQSVARRLRSELGIKSVFVLKGGWGAWIDAQKQKK